MPELLLGHRSILKIGIGTAQQISISLEVRAAMPVQQCINSLFQVVFLTVSELNLRVYIIRYQPVELVVCKLDPATAGKQQRQAYYS